METQQTGAPAAQNATRKNWYVIRTHTGHESAIRDVLRQRMRRYGLQDKLGEILVPTESRAETAAGGTSSVKQRVSLPGYVFVELEMSERARHVITDTFRVRGFVGGRTPLQVSPAEIDVIRGGIERVAPKPSPQVSYRIGDRVRVVEGPFLNFSGRVDEVSTQRHKAKVRISMFGRPMPVELDFSSIAKQA